MADEKDRFGEIMKLVERAAVVELSTASICTL